MNKYIKISFHHSNLKYQNGEKYFSTSSPNIKDATNQPGWRCTKNSLVAQTDMHGIYKIFYYIDKEIIIVANNLQDIIHSTSNLEFDYSALAVFLRTGFFIEHDSPYEKIKALGPNGRLSIENGNINISEKHYWSKNTCQIKKEDAIEQYCELFSASIKNLNSEKLCIPLSGGRDSRHIFLEAKKQHLNINKLITTYFEPDNNYTADVSIASLLASKSKENLEILKNKSNWLEREKLKNRLTDYSTLLHSWYLDLANSMPENSVILDGLGGDILSESKKYRPEIYSAFKKKNWGVLLKHYLGNDDKTINILSTSFASKVSYDKAKERLLPCLKKYSKYPNPQSAFEFYNRTVNCIAPASQKLLTNQSVFYPFLEKNLFEFLTSIPTNLFPENNFHSLVINRSYPEFSDVPYTLPLSNLKPYKKSFRIYYNLKKNFELIKLITKPSAADFLNIPMILPKLIISSISPIIPSKHSWIDSRLVYLVGLHNEQHR